MSDSPGKNTSVPRLRTLLLVAAAVSLIQIALARSLENDAYFPKYWLLAADLLEGGIDRDRLNDVSPLYLWIVALFRAPDLDPLALRLMQFLANGITFALAVAIAFRLAGRTAAVTTGACLVGSAIAFLNAAELEPEALILLLNTLGLYALLAHAPSRRSTFIGALFFGLSAVARPVVLPGALALLAVTIQRPRESTGDRGRLARFGAAASGLVAPVVAAMALTWALTGHPSIMNPGTVFHEGNNALATGLAATEPLIVSDVRASIDEPDPLHQAYRTVASRAIGAPLSPELSNRFWTDRALAHLIQYPDRAASLFLRKMRFALHGHPAWDIRTTVKRARETASWPWIPFGVVAALALVALLARPERSTLALGVFVGGYIVVMTVFYVSGRQQNAILSATAVLAGVGVARTLDLVRRDRRRAILIALLTLVVAIALTLPTNWHREYEHEWTAAFSSEAVVVKRKREKVSESESSARLRAVDRTWLLGDDPDIPSASRELVGQIARAELGHATTSSRLFDLAVALQYAGDWETSEIVLASLDGAYSPRREGHAVDSVAWYRAIAARRLGEENRYRALLNRAATEAPTDPLILSTLWIEVGDERARAALFTLHDRHTAELAIARAQLRAGQIPAAARTAQKVAREIPEWNRARLLAEYLSDLEKAYH